MFKLTSLDAILLIVFVTLCFQVLVSNQQEIEFEAEKLNAGPKNIWYHDLGVARVSRGNKVQEIVTEVDVSRNATTTSEPATEDGEIESDNKNKQCNFDGKIMKVALSPQPPFVNCAQNLYGEWNCNGSNIEVLEVLAERLNFKPELVVLTMSQWGSKPETNSNESHANSLDQQEPIKQKSPEYTGVLGLVAKGRALMSANGLIETSDRQDLLLSQPFDMFRLHLLLSKSVREHDHIFIKPFSPQTWAAILISALLVVPIFYFINSTTGYYLLQEDKSLSRLPLWVCIRVVAKQIFDRHNHKQHLRPKQRQLVSSKFPLSSSFSSSSSSSFDNEIDQLASAPIALIELSTTRARPSAMRPTVSKHQRRMMHQKWAMDRKRARRLARVSQTSGFSKVAYLVWYVVSSLANQGGETEDLPGANSTRILVAFWWLYLIVVVAIHSGILTAILTFPKQNDYIQTLEDYLDLSAYERALMRLSVARNSELSHYLEDIKNFQKSPLQLIIDKAITESPGQEPTELPFEHVDFLGHRARVLDDIQAGHRALIEEKSTIDQIVTREFFDHKPPLCLFKSSKFAIDIIPMRFALSKSLITPTCLDAINSILKNILKTGLAIKWRRRYEAQGNDCLNTVIINAGDVDKIEYRHVKAAFWLLGVGLMIGSVALILELVWLFTIDDEDDEEDDQNSDEESTTESLSLTSDSSDTDSDDDVKLGHRIMYPMQVRSMDIKRKLKRFKAKHPTDTLGALDLADKIPDIPTIVLPLELNTNLVDQLHTEQIDIEKKKDAKKQKRQAKAAEKRSRRLKRTLDLVKRLQDGKIYSQKLKQRARRASHAIIGRLAPTQLHEGHRRGSRRHSQIRIPSQISVYPMNRLEFSPAW